MPEFKSTNVYIQMIYLSQFVTRSTYTAVYPLSGVDSLWYDT
jgi:hypothetical protein